MLAADASLHSDGGGKIPSYNILRGADPLLRLFLGISRKFGPAEHLGRVTIDGLPGFISRIGGVVQTTALAFDGESIAGIYITRNPDKLTRIVRH